MIAFIVNPKSRAGKTGKAWPEIENEIKKYFGQSYSVAFTEFPLHAVQLTRQFIQDGADFLIAVGGDGTLNEVINGFFQKDRLINPEAAAGILAFGTGADFIRTIDWPGNFSEALSRLTNPQTRLIDIGRAEFIDMAGQKTRRYFVNVADFGIGGAVVDRVNRTTKRFGGRVSFLWAIVTTLLTYKNQKVRFRLDGGPVSDEKINNFIVANGRFFGGGLNPAPQAELNDGWLDVVTIGDVSFVEAIRNFPKLQAGKHLTLPKINAYRAKTVVAESDETVLIDLDGEWVGRLPIRIEILPAVLKICI